MGATEPDLAVLLPGGFVLLAPEVSGIVARTLERYAAIEQIRRLPPAVEHVRRICLTASSQAGGGHADVRNSPPPAESGTWIRTIEAAELLGCTQRHCSRLAASGELGPTRKERGSWMVLEDEIAALAAVRRPA